jgi:hypothetical protein
VVFSCEWIDRNGVPWDDAIVVWAGKLRRLWDFLSELHSSLCERPLKRTFLRPALLPVKTAQFTVFSVRYAVTQYNRSVYLTVFRVFKAWVCGRSLVGIAIWNGCRSDVRVVSGVSVAVSATGWSLVQRSQE